MNSSRHIDKDVGDTSLPNISSFLKIRKKTTIQFLAENNITEMYMLGSFLSNMRNKFFITEQFIDEAVEHLNKVSKVEEIVVEEKETKVLDAEPSTYDEDVLSSTSTRRKQQTTKPNTKSKKVD